MFDNKKENNAKGSKFVDEMRERQKKRLKSGIEIMTIGGDETVKGAERMAKAQKGIKKI